MAPRYFTWNPFAKKKDKDKSHPVEVFHPIEIDPQEIAKIRELCPQFRILIVGRANSGKTTIIQKMCDTDEDPIVHDQYGNEIPASVLQDPNAMRGIHDIRLQITFKSNPNFVFHDSMGFEAGSADEVQKVEDFIQECLAKTELCDRLHMIWYCVPTDSDRVASKAELSFFQHSTGGIPVIVLFTKWDGQIIDAYNNLRRRENMDRRQALQEAPARAQKVLEEEYIPVFMNTPCPPVSYTVLGHMDKPETKCKELSEKTAAALDNNVLKKLFVSVQTHNLELCVKSAMNELIFVYYGYLKDEDVLRVVISWFPHIYYNWHDYSQAEEFIAEEFIEGPIAEEGFQHLLPLFQPFLSSSAQAFSSQLLQNLNAAACAAIVAVRSFEVSKRTGSTPQAVQVSINEYLASSQYATVKAAITSKFNQYANTSPSNLPTNALKRIWEDLQQLCLDNLLG